MEPLITHHDGKYGHVHKTLGFLSLGHFIRRFGEFALYRVMTFDRTAWIFIAIHALLSWSSLIFYLTSFRSAMAPTIWPEFRAHSILFASRSLAAMSLTLSGLSTPLTRFVNVFGTIVLADLATHYYAATKTTMRDMPFPDWVSQRARDRLNLYYSVSQVLATAGLLFSPSMDRAFFILFPIQIAAFLMTLVRKRMLSPLGWHVLYAISLGLNYVHGAFALDALPALFYITSLVFCILRFRYRVNKYLLWGLIGLAQNELVHATVVSSVQPWISTLSSFGRGQMELLSSTSS
jgi:hypothetical protein